MLILGVVVSIIGTIVFFYILYRVFNSFMDDVPSTPSNCNGRCMVVDYPNCCK